ncbi:MAG: hypothetical protein JXB07_01290 [Anaerolineae bacterium]|nr:hypothetical protein [Anaerolineae bacterium]
MQHSLQCHFSGKDLARFMLIAFPPFVVGGIGIAHLSAWYLVPWVILFLSYFGLIEIRVMCSHCPHYAEPRTLSLQCWANYGAPKLWEYRPGPMTRGENIVFFAGLVLIAGYPLAFLMIGTQWLLLTIFVLTTAAMGTLMATLMCNHCMNFACPLNRVEQSVREDFFSRNPVVARAWGRASLSERKTQ